MIQFNIEDKALADRSVALMLLAKYKHQLRRPQLLEEKNKLAEENFIKRKALYPSDSKPHELKESLTGYDLQVLKMSWAEFLGFNDRPDLISQISPEEFKNYGYEYEKTKSRMRSEADVLVLPPRNKKHKQTKT